MASEYLVGSISTVQRLKNTDVKGKIYCNPQSVPKDTETYVRDSMKVDEQKENGICYKQHCNHSHGGFLEVVKLVCTSFRNKDL